MRFKAPLKLTGRIMSGKPRARAGAGSLFALCFFCAGLFAGSVYGGHANSIMAGAGKSLGFDQVRVSLGGHERTSEADILAALGAQKTDSLAGFDVKRARAAVLALPWIEAVGISKLYPDRLLVNVRESRAFGIWQNGGKLSLVRRDGKIIEEFESRNFPYGQFADLPHLVGTGAAHAAEALVPLMGEFPDFAERVKAYVRIAERRWDVQFKNDVRVNLPASDPKRALNALADLQEKHGILERAVSAIDLRLTDRAVFRLTPEGLEEHERTVERRLKTRRAAMQDAIQRQEGQEGQEERNL